MLGRISQDFVVEARDTPYNAPPNMGYYQNPMRQNMLTLPPIGSAKLSGMYNSLNMPVVIASGGQTVRWMQKHGGVRNDQITIISFPKRMPYNVYR